MRSGSTRYMGCNGFFLWNGPCWWLYLIPSQPPGLSQLEYGGGCMSCRRVLVESTLRYLDKEERYQLFRQLEWWAQLSPRPHRPCVCLRFTLNNRSSGVLLSLPSTPPSLVHITYLASSHWWSGLSIWRVTSASHCPPMVELWGEKPWVFLLWFSPRPLPRGHLALTEWLLNSY